MRPESFPTDDSLGRSVQPPSAPLSAKEGAFGEENAPYEAVFGDVSKIIDAARESAVRSVNAAMTAAYWLIGRRIVEFEQSGEERAEYAAALIERLAEDLTGRFDCGFSRQNVQNMRLFYLSMADSPDAVWHIRSRLRRTGLRRPSRGLPAPLVCLRAAAVGQERERPRVLRDRGAARRVVGPPDRPADRLPVLRAHRPLQEQGLHADGRTHGAREPARWTELTGGLMERENPPVGLILCSEKDEALARYALEGLPNNVMAAEYRITLPDETVLAAELDRTRQAMEEGGDAL